MATVGRSAHTARAGDRFYTKPDVAAACLAFLAPYAAKIAPQFWVEPSAGAGAFLAQLPYPRVGLDLQPAADEVMEADFLQWHPSSTPLPIAGPIAGPFAVVGNPPFGKNSSLAVQFFNHAATFADLIAMILPRTFRKPSVINRLDQRFHLRDEFLLQPHAFEFEGVPYDVPTVFQVWVRAMPLRALIAQQKTHSDFTFVRNASDADFALQRVGANAGRVKYDAARVSPSSHYFIKAHCAEAASNAFAELDWNSVKHDTAGNPSLSKADVVMVYASRECCIAP